MRRFISFVRPVLPADPWQLVFLAGLVCLTVTPRLGWWATQHERSVARLSPHPFAWYLYSFGAALLMVSGGAGGYAAVF
jgi:hypothetical protein